MVSFFEDYTSASTSASTLFSDFRFASDPLPEELVGSLYDEFSSTSNSPSVVPSSSQDSSLFHAASSFTLDSDNLLSSLENDEIIEHLLSSDFEQPQSQQPQQQYQQYQLPQIQFQFHVEQVDSPNSFFSSPSSAWNSSASSAPSSPSSSVPSSPFALSPFLSSPVSPACWVPLSPNSNNNNNNLLYSNAHHSYSPSFAPTLKAPLTSNDCALCEMIPAKKVAVSVRGKPLITTTLKEFYGERIREQAITNALLLDAHPQFTSHEDAVGSIYILRNVSARKPPQIAKKAFNCHTRKEAGLAHWQYNVPGTDFTCRVSEWTIDGVMYNSYHYYRSPLARPSRRVKPY